MAKGFAETETLMLVENEELTKGESKTPPSGEALSAGPCGD